MAEFIVKIGDNKNDDPEKDTACFKDGDLICAERDNHPWTVKERELYDVVKAPGLSLGKARRYTKIWRTGSGKRMARSEWRFDRLTKKLFSKKTKASIEVERIK